jgi:hypothetical protein
MIDNIKGRITNIELIVFLLKGMTILIVFLFLSGGEINVFFYSIFAQKIFND